MLMKFLSDQLAVEPANLPQEIIPGGAVIIRRVFAGVPAAVKTVQGDPEIQKLRLGLVRAEFPRALQPRERTMDSNLPVLINVVCFDASLLETSLQRSGIKRRRW